MHLYAGGGLNVRGFSCLCHCTFSEYSLLESCIKIDALVKQARAFGYRALALTDHNTMAGLVEFTAAVRQMD